MSESDATRTTGRRRAAAGIGALTAAVAMTGCGPTLSMVTAPWTESQAIIESSLFGKKNVTFDAPPVISVEEGRIKKVVVTDPGGERVGGSVVAGGTGWQIDTADLDFGTKYAVRATAVDMRGNATTARETFKTFVPERELVATSNLSAGATYGVGIPIIVTFNEPVKDKAAIEERMHVTTNSPKPVVGAWNWESDSQATYRPKKYWPANTKVTFAADIKGINSGDDAYALDNKLEKFKIGDKVVITQDSAAKQMVVRKNGEVVRTMPTSTGKPGHETRSGTKLIMSKEQHVVMDAATLGVSKDDPDYYRLDVYWAMRVTWSGEYIHSAPWSVGSQGYANVSHGCINVAPGNAVWLFNFAKVGDVVDVKNTGVSQDLGNGWTMWEESWKDWKSGSALKA